MVEAEGRTQGLARVVQGVMRKKANPLAVANLWVAFAAFIGKAREIRVSEVGITMNRDCKHIGTGIKNILLSPSNYRR